MAKKKVEESNKELMRELDINKKDLVDEIKKEIKESLDKEIEKKVDYESKDKLDKMEKRIYRQKIFAIIKRDIIILILLGLSLYEAKILYDNGLLFGLNKKEEVKQVVKVEDNEENKEEKDSKWYIDNYSYLLDNIKTNLEGEDKYYLYNNISSSDIKNTVRLNMAYQLLDVKSIDGIFRVSEDTLKEAYNKIFNIDSYISENFNNSCINFIYNKDTKTYMAIDITCENDNTEIFRNIKNIYEEDDKIVIEAKVGILDRYNNKISIINGETFDYNEENIDKLNTYKFIFKDNYLDEIIFE
jgi:hypothetical protein